MKLLCRNFAIISEIDAPLRANVEFAILITPPYTTEEEKERFAKTLYNLAQLFTTKDGIEIIQTTKDKKRCFYCAGLNEEDALKCTHCGAQIV